MLLSVHSGSEFVGLEMSDALDLQTSKEVTVSATYKMHVTKGA